LKQPGARIVNAAQSVRLAHGTQEYVLQQIVALGLAARAMAQEAAQLRGMGVPGVGQALHVSL
jgi:hypothetical protein